MNFQRILLAAAGVAALVLAAAAGANAAAFGGYYLQVNICCGGAGLYGTRASITTPLTSGDISLPSRCVGGRSDAEIGGTRLIQAGFYRCNSGYGIGSPGSAFVCNAGGLNSFTEIYLNNLSTCYQRGGVAYNTTHLYTVRRTSGDTWYSYVDGVADPHWLVMGGAQYLIEGPEYQGACSDTWRAYADWGHSTAWQRWTGSAWYTVQSAYQNASWMCANWRNVSGPPSWWRVAR
jgi:hypothetical protein